MSIEALAYAKTMDLGTAESAAARLLVYVIAENTFNDSFVCRLSQAQLAYEAGRVSERSVRRYLESLEAARMIVRPRKQKRNGDTGQMSGDVLRLRGFKGWYLRDHAVKQRRHKAKSPADRLSGGDENGPGTTGGQIVRRPPDTYCPPAAGQQLSGAYKDNRTSKSVPLARERAVEGFKSDLEGKGVRTAAPAIPITQAETSFAAWMAHLRGLGRHDIAERAEEAGRIIATSRYPKPGSPLPIVRKAEAA